MTYGRRLSATLLDTDANTVIPNALDNAFGISGMIELSGYGIGEVSLPFDDPNKLECRRGRYVRVSIGGTPRFHFKIGGAPRYNQADPDNEIAESVTISGQGWGSMLEEPVVMPEHPDLTLPLDYSYRLFSFASINNPNTSGYGPAVERYEYFDLTEAATRGRMTGVEDTGPDIDDPADDIVRIYPAPIGFPWPNAIKNGNGFTPTPTYEPTYWITADGAPTEGSIGTHFFRHPGVVLAGDQMMTIFVTGDNLFTVFLNGVPILGEDADIAIWQAWKEVTLTLPAGTHYFAAAVENVDVPSLSFNPGGFLFDAVALAVYPGDTDTSLTLVLAASDSSWDSTFSDGDWPGWTAGQIVLQLLSEAIASGHLTAYDALGAETFAGLTDSEGNAYASADVDDPTAFIPAFSCRVGQTYGDVLRQLHDQGWGDWLMDPEGLNLHWWAPGSLTTVSGVEYHYPTDVDDPETGNLVRLERGETKPYANRLIVQWAGGLEPVDNTGEQSSYGTVVSDIFVTDAATRSEAARLGRIELGERVKSERAAIIIEVEPSSTADCPLEAFTVGHYIEIPNVEEDGTDTEAVLAIYFTGDDEGWVKWRMEVGSRWRAPQLEWAETLRNLGGKTLGSPSNHGVAKD